MFGRKEILIMRLPRIALMLLVALAGLAGCNSSVPPADRAALQPRARVPMLPTLAPTVAASPATLTMHPTTAIAPSPTLAQPSASIDSAAETTPVPTIIGVLTPHYEPCSPRALTTVQLPSPIYFLDAGEIARLERDGATCTHVTNGRLLSMYSPAPFDISPRDGSLAYSVEGSGCVACLIQADGLGQHPRILLSTTSSIRALRWSPDGSRIAVQILRGEYGDLPNGVYMIPNGGGTPQPVLSTAYAPWLWSPDGSRLLQSVESRTGNLIFTVYNIASGQIITPSLPVSRNSDNTDGDFFAWSADGAMLYQVLEHLGSEVWRLDALNGVLTPFLVGRSEDGARTRAASLSVAPDGWVYTFLAMQAPLQTDGNLQYGMYRISADGSKRERLRPESFQLGYKGIYWAPDHSGALAMMTDTNIDSGEWFWVPTDGQPLVGLGISVGALRWGLLPAGAAPAPTPVAAGASATALAPTATSAPASSHSTIRLSAPLASGMRVRKFQLSGDDRYAVYLVGPTGAEGEEATLYSVPLTGGTARQLGDVQWTIYGGYRYDITSDGRYVLYHRESGIYIVPIDGGPSSRLVAADNYEISLDGRFVIAETVGEAGHTILLSVPLDGSAPITLGDGLSPGAEPDPWPSDSRTASLTWTRDYRLTPDGRSVVYRTVDALFSVPIGGGTPVKLSSTPEPGMYIHGYIITPDSQRVIYDTRQYKDGGCRYTPSSSSSWPKITAIYSAPIGGGSLVKLASAPAEAGGLDFGYVLSYDGAQLFYSPYTETTDCGFPSAGDEIYAVPASGGTPQRAMAYPARSYAGAVRDPRVFVQGGALYSRPNAGQTPIRLHNPAAMGSLAADSFSIYDDEEEYRNADRQEDAYQISPDGRWVVYRTHDGDFIATNLYRVSLQGGTVVPLSPPIGLGGAIEGVQISPDGRRVIYKAAQPPAFTFDLYSVPLQGGAALRLSQPLGPNGGVGDAQLTADSRRVVYMAAQAQPSVFELYVVDIE
jgi:Tol biopolymer transport system component